ncbi:Cof-type HAD-IIB family hydrolase [Evansella cellulosilytica]|uniref:Cof-like hydrolase n=1 Tax=Evansella cellulosilytica (strain ATCC 21833 / DSM 2522 / FERM P-1141 / JCM 9156 / N-4) TaxID=649639 RepID=E6TUN7_EVAC2|nr:Cof-type HAD-IIB family hydrolase [Evansella cellulosilytica]ADU30927.1 Cof-like hydrolase [Evansella cellulosilytica DSM 2522]
MDKKVVFFDIDGTLLNENNVIPESTKNAIKELQKKDNIFVAIATGRAPLHLREISSQLGIDSYVSFNGSYVVFNGEVLSSNPLAKKEMLELEARARENGHPMVFLNESDIYANVSDHPAILSSMGSLNLPHPDKHESFHHDNSIYQALLFVDKNEESFYSTNHAFFDYVRWHERAIDVLPSGGSKAKGIENMLKELNIDKKDAFAFGDGLNDLEMLQYVGCGIAMGNAVEEAKKAADIVTDHVNDDGIYKGLVKVGLL